MSQGGLWKTVGVKSVAPSDYAKPRKSKSQEVWSSGILPFAKNAKDGAPAGIIFEWLT